MGRVVGITELPVPAVRWVEPDAAVLGEPFFVMERVDGDVPPDIPPYDMGGWVLDATAEQRAPSPAHARLDVLAGLCATTEHRRPISTSLQFDWPGDTALRRHLANERHYWDWIADGRRLARWSTA